jgi:predicted alpha-1,2-mannosidase
MIKKLSSIPSGLLILAAGILIGCETKTGYLQYVDPLIGTDATHFISEWRSEACTYPGAVAPHGMIQITPETHAPGDYLRGYYHSQDTIRRFSLVEHFSGWPDGSAGKGLLMPFCLEDTLNVQLRNASSYFTHEKEVASPGYYEVFLEDSRIICSFASLTRSAMGKFVFVGEGTKGLILGGFKSFESLNEKEVRMMINTGSGYIGRSSNALYITIRFDHPHEIRDYQKVRILTFPDMENKDVLKFKIGVSYTSAENATLNLDTEIPGWELRMIKQQAEDLWNTVLNRVEVNGGTEEDKIMFYTGLYHASLLPINATDVNKAYPGQGLNEPLRADETHYIYYTPWDGFRSLYPLINLLYPEKGKDYLRSALRIYRATGRLPEPEVMTGVHMSVLFADAIAKNIEDFDLKLAYKALSQMILEPPFFRPDMALYDSLGYIPYPHRYATSATLEFAFNDWALSELAARIGEGDVAKILLERSLNYQNNYKPETRFMETRMYDGSWAEASLYAEANKWNMSWFAPHDTQGLINLMGGDEAFCEHLERNFAEEHFVLDNECPMNFPFLFSYAGKPWKTMEWKDKSMRYFFNATPGGIPGNDDWGSISSWCLWGALGFFPVCPGTEELVITGPVFEEVIINHPEAGEVTITASDVSPENIYVQQSTLKAKPYERAFVRQSDLLQARGINFEMGPKPNKSWGANDMPPYSVTTSKSDLKVVSIESEKSKVHSHEAFNLLVEIENTGSIGSFPMYVTLDNDTVYSDFTLLQKGRSKLVTIPLQLYKGGKSELKVGNKSVVVVVEATTLSPEEAFMFSEPVVSSLVKSGSSIPYHTTVQNVSGQTSALAPALFLDGANLKTLPEVHLEPGESQEITGILEGLSSTGFHTLSIGNSPTKRFKVFTKPEETMVLHYSFDQVRNGTVLDESGFENHGKIVGRLQYVSGADGQGIIVQNGHVKVPESKSLAIEDETLTMICWYKPADEDGKASLVTKGGHNMMKLNGKWQLQLAIGGWGVGQCSYNVPYDPVTKGPKWQDKWCHFAGTRSGDTLNIYYNGQHVSTLAVKGTIGRTDFPWCIGTNAEIPIGRTPDGVIDEVMIFAGALNQEQIAAILKKTGSKIKP